MNGLFESPDELPPLFDKEDAAVVKAILGIVLLPSVLSAFIALLVPNNIFELMPQLQVVATVLVKYLPFMSERIAVSEIPQVLALTYSISWFALPVQMFLLPYCWFRYANPVGPFSRLRIQGRSLWKMRLAAYIFLLIYAHAMTLNGSYLFLGIDAVNDRVGLALIGSFGFQIINMFWLGCLALTFVKNSFWE